MAAKRRFGRVRELPSGRWQARYKGPDGIDRPAPQTFARKVGAEKWLVKTAAEIDRDLWLNPDDGKVTFADYATLGSRNVRICGQVPWRSTDNRPELR